MAEGKKGARGRRSTLEARLAALALVAVVGILENAARGPDFSSRKREVIGIEVGEGEGAYLSFGVDLGTSGECLCLAAIAGEESPPAMLEETGNLVHLDARREGAQTLVVNCEAITDGDDSPRDRSSRCVPSLDEIVLVAGAGSGETAADSHGIASIGAPLFAVASSPNRGGGGILIGAQDSAALLLSAAAVGLARSFNLKSIYTKHA